MAAAASTSMAAIAAPVHRLANATKSKHAAFLPLLPPSLLCSSPFKHLKESRRSSQLMVKASSSDKSSSDTNELFTDLKGKWDAIEDKSTVLLYGGASILAVWLASIVIDAINSVPLLPNIMELVGLGYTGWFVYRYLLFQSSRRELATDVEAIKKKIAGTE